jgi:transposase-like protein
VEDIFIACIDGLTGFKDAILAVFPRTHIQRCVIHKVTKTKGAFPIGEAARKLLFLANRDITRKWTAPVHNWTRILNQLAIRFDGRFPT